MPPQPNPHYTGLISLIPPFKPVPWWDADPPLTSNGTIWTGGIWLPPRGPLTEQKD